MVLRVEIAVIGLGAAGAAALWNLARMGRDVIGIDQFEAPHDRGSSHGQTRLLRVAYAEGEQYVPLVRRSIALWRELEKETGQDIFHQTGVFYAGPQGNEFVVSSRASAARHSVRLDVNASQNRMSVPDTWTSFVEEEGGFVESDRAMRGFIAQAQQAGARLHLNSRVRAISVRDNGVEISVGGETIFADKIVVATGGWALELLPELARHLWVERRVLHWFDDLTGDYSLKAGFKPFIIDTHDGSAFYGFPAIDETGIKVADHTSGGEVATLDNLRREVSTEDVAAITALTRRFLPALSQPRRSVVCPYPMSADGHFIVDVMPSSLRVVVGVGLCGHGFKFAPAIGEALALLALGRGSATDIGFLSAKRF